MEQSLKCPRQVGATLVEVLVVASLFLMMMTVVLSFYLEATAVSAKRDEQSQRLRRYHIGLKKLEALLSESRVAGVGNRVITLWRLSDQAERDGFPLFDQDPVQIYSTKEGVFIAQGEEVKNVLPLLSDETVFFGWETQYPGSPPADRRIVRLSLYREGKGQKASLYFSRRIILLEKPFAKPQ